MYNILFPTSGLIIQPVIIDIDGCRYCTYDIFKYNTYVYLSVNTFALVGNYWTE